MDSRYAVVLWSDEPAKYSCVRISKIQYDPNVFSEESMLVDQIFNIQPEKSSPEAFAAKVINVGSRAKMSQQAANMAEEAGDLSMVVEEDNEKIRLRKRKKDSGKASTTKTKKRKATNFDQNPDGDRENVQVQNAGDICINSENGFEEANDGLMQNVEYRDLEGERHPDSLPDANVSRVTDLEKDKLIESLRTKLQRKERKIAELQKKLSRLEPEDTVDVVDIGGGFHVSTQVVADLKMDYRHNPGMFLRKLMEKSNLFTLKEIADSSITGQKFRDGSHRPRLHPAKFNACKDFTIKKCKLKEDTLRMMQFKKSIINICTDARKRIKKCNNPLNTE